MAELEPVVFSWDRFLRWLWCQIDWSNFLIRRNLHSTGVFSLLESINFQGYASNDVRGGRRKKWDEKKEIRDHISSYILSMREAFKALDKEFLIGFLVMKSSYAKKYLKTMNAYWGIKSFTFYSDIICIDLETMGIKGEFSLYIIMKKEDVIKDSFLWKYTTLILNLH